MSTQSSPAHFHKNILRWYAVHRRMLPWRKTSDPYRILISELMAQQTQVSRAAEFYSRWLKQFPNFKTLAAAPAAEVLRAWSGLGYNSRALRFHQLSKIVANMFRSRLPKDPEVLQTLPGIGRYTAHAVCCFAYGMPVPVVDVNIRRILTRWSSSIITAGEQLPEKTAWVSAEHLLPKKNAPEWNQALMDFGAMVCTARKPRCGECPVARYCASAHSPVFLVRQQRRKKKEPVWKGIPRRLYRGKVLKMLHHLSLSAEEIAFRIWNDPMERDIDWIGSLLEQMQKDGLLSRRGRRFRIVLS